MGGFDVYSQIMGLISSLVVPKSIDELEHTFPLYPFVSFSIRQQRRAAQGTPS